MHDRLNLIPYFTHVRVRAAFDREHGWYTSFTLYRGCASLPTSGDTHQPRVMNPIHLFQGGEAGCQDEVFPKFHCNTPSTPGPAVLTPGSSLGSYIVPADQQGSFVRTLSSLMRTRENILVGHPSQIATSQERSNCSKPSTLNLEVPSR